MGQAFLESVDKDWVGTKRKHSSAVIAMVFAMLRRIDEEVRKILVANEYQVH